MCQCPCHIRCPCVCASWILIEAVSDVWQMSMLDINVSYNIQFIHFLIKNYSEAFVETLLRFFIVLRFSLRQSYRWDWLNASTMTAILLNLKIFICRVKVYFPTFDIYWLLFRVFSVSFHIADQSVVDHAINDICVLMQCSRHNLNVVDFLHFIDLFLFLFSFGSLNLMDFGNKSTIWFLQYVSLAAYSFQIGS